jgi:hypothetical protein
MHLTDEQLNGYLDNESINRTAIEAHLASCNECAARLADLQALFTELDALPDVPLSTNIAARFVSSRNLTLQFPRWLTLTATLQAVAALVVLIIAIPVLSVMLPRVEMPSLTPIFLQIQSQWIALLDMLSKFHFPTFKLTNLPAPEMSTLIIALACISVLWIFGNGLLLRNRNR